MIHSDEIPELFKRLQAFQEERLHMIAASKTPFALPIDADGLLVVHVMPLDAFSFGSYRARAIDLLENDPPPHAARIKYRGWPCDPGISPTKILLVTTRIF
jgi:hypothetical protein